MRSFFLFFLADQIIDLSMKASVQRIDKALKMCVGVGGKSSEGKLFRHMHRMKRVTEKLPNRESRTDNHLSHCQKE